MQHTNEAQVLLLSEALEQEAQITSNEHGIIQVEVDAPSVLAPTNQANQPDNQANQPDNQANQPDNQANQPDNQANQPDNEATRLLREHRNIVNQGPADPDANKKRFAARAGSWALVLSPSFAAYAALGKCFFDVSCMSYLACISTGVGLGAGTSLVLTACMKCGPADCCCELAGREYDDQQQTNRYTKSTYLLSAASIQRGNGATPSNQPKTFCCLTMR